MTRTTIILISLLAFFDCLAQGAGQDLKLDKKKTNPTHIGAFGTGLTYYKNLDTPIHLSFLNVDSDWDNGLKSSATVQVKTMGDELAFGLNLGLNKQINKKTTLKSVSTLYSGDWQPNLSQEFAISKKTEKGFVKSASGTLYLAQNRKPIVVLCAGVLKAYGNSSISLKAFNQMSEAGFFNPTLAASYIYASKKGNIIALFAQTGTQSAIDNLLGAGTASLRQVGGGLWFKLNLSQSYYVLGSMGINSFSSSDANFASQSFKLSFHIK